MSSSAQLVLLPWLLGWEQPAHRTAFGAGLHAGSCLGIAWGLRADLRRLTGRDVAVLAAASVPAAVAGLVAADAVEERLGRPPQLAALLAGAGALMWWVDARAARADGRGPATADGPDPATVPPGRQPAEAPPPLSAARDSHRAWPVRTVDRRQVAWAAAAQAVALVPGVSRSGATLAALRATGVDRAGARRFSLLMSLPITAGAAALSLARADRAALRELGPGLAAGTVTAALAGAAAATAHRRSPGRGVSGAALYRLVLAAVVARHLVRKGAS